jgi:hypothetical protein
MALLNEIIKRYDAEAKQRIAEARAMKNVQAEPDQNSTIWSGKAVENGDGAMVVTRPQLDLSTKDPTPQDMAYFDWHNKMVEFHNDVKKCVFFLSEFSNSTQVLTELERLRSENMELKEKLKQYEKTE